MVERSSYKPIIHIALAVLMCAPVLVVFFGSVSGAEPPVTGSWTITDDTVLDGVDVTIDGNISVEAGASFSLVNSTLRMASPGPWTLSIWVRDGGRFDIVDSTLTDGNDVDSGDIHSEDDRHYRVLWDRGSEGVVVRSTVEFAGYNYDDMLAGNSYGLSARAADISMDNSTFRHCSDIWISHASPRIADCEFKGAGGRLFLHDFSGNVERNSFTNVEIGIHVSGQSYPHVHNNTFSQCDFPLQVFDSGGYYSGNSFLSNSHNSILNGCYGVFTMNAWNQSSSHTVMVEDSPTVQFLENTFGGSPWTHLWIDRSNVTLRGNTFVGSESNALTAYSSYVEMLNNHVTADKGLYAHHSTVQSHDNRYASMGNPDSTGVYLDNCSDTSLDGDRLTGFTTGVNIQGGDNLSIHGASIGEARAGLTLSPHRLYPERVVEMTIESLQVYNATTCIVLDRANVNASYLWLHDSDKGIYLHDSVLWLSYARLECDGVDLELVNRSSAYLDFTRLNTSRAMWGDNETLMLDGQPASGALLPETGGVTKEFAVAFWAYILMATILPALFIMLVWKKIDTDVHISRTYWVSAVGMVAGAFAGVALLEFMGDLDYPVFAFVVSPIAGGLGALSLLNLVRKAGTVTGREWLFYFYLSLALYCSPLPLILIASYASLFLIYFAWAILGTVSMVLAYRKYRRVPSLKPFISRAAYLVAGGAWLVTGTYIGLQFVLGNVEADNAFDVVWFVFTPLFVGASLLTMLVAEIRGTDPSGLRLVTAATLFVLILLNPLAIIARVALAAVIASGAAVAFLTEPGTYNLFTAAVPLYSRLRKDDVEKQETRVRIQDHLADHPGSTYSELKRILELNNGTLAYHLRVLEREGMIKARRVGRYKLFYPWTILRRDMTDPGPLTESQKAVLDAVAEHPGISQREIVRLTGLRQQTVSGIVHALNDRGVIFIRKLGRATLCRVNGNGEAHPEPEMPQVVTA